MSCPGDVQDEILAHGKLLEQFGPQLGRPRVDTLKGSHYGNMKELRFDAADGVWRVAFAFDPRRRAVLLIARATNPVPRNADCIDNCIEKADARYGAFGET